MFYAAYRLNDTEHGKLYTSYTDFYRDTFSPESETLVIVPFKVRGKTYHEKQENVRNQALDWQSYYNLYDWSYGELLAVQEWFQCVGARYGLLKEFRENAIC